MFGMSTEEASYLLATIGIANTIGRIVLGSFCTFLVFVLIIEIEIRINLKLDCIFLQVTYPISRG